MRVSVIAAKKLDEYLLAKKRNHIFTLLRGKIGRKMGAKREEILKRYESLRVADVSDGMDWCMFHDVGLMSSVIRPIFRTRICGIARTARYIPTARKIPTTSADEYDGFVAMWYRDICPYPFGEKIERGDVVVIDASGLDVGLLGSNNVLAFINRGARGLIIDGGCRDTDEIIIQKCPVWCRHISRTMVQGRIEFAAMDGPISCGGVKVNPGDVVVADGDGVIIVPRDRALDVAKYAARELERDKKTRRKLYKKAALPLDETVR